MSQAHLPSSPFMRALLRVGSEDSAVTLAAAWWGLSRRDARTVVQTLRAQGDTK